MNYFHPKASHPPVPLICKPEQRGLPLTAPPETSDADSLKTAPAIRRRELWLVLLPLLLYAAALNPFFLPYTFDNVVYYSGAVSLAEEGGFKFNGKYVSDWPPGPSVLLALPFLFGLESVWTAKICILLCAAAGLILCLRLFQHEQRPYPVATVLVFASLSYSFMMGTRIMSEWPYFLASMLFLHALHLAGERRTLFWALAAGLLLGAASLTKFTGVLLGAAVLAQMLEQWTRSRERSHFRRIRPETIAALIGGLMFVAWKLKLTWQIHAGTAAHYDYYRGGWWPEHLGLLAVFNVPGKISDLFFHSSAMSVLGWDGWAVRSAWAVPGVIVLLGLALRLGSRDRKPADWYVLSLLILFCAVGTNQQTRYLLPIAPFLINYGFIGFRHLVRRAHLAERWPSLRPARIGRAIVTLWIAALVASACHLLFIGSLSGIHRGLCFAVSRTPETFYRGFWLDLYQACHYVKNDPAPGNLAVIGDEDKYVTAFSGRRRVDFEPGAEFAFVLALNPAGLPDDQLDALNLRLVQRYRSVVLYRKYNEPHASSAFESAHLCL